MSFPRPIRTAFTRWSPRRGSAATIAYDAAHDAIFYSGEFTDLLVRYDRRTQAQFDDAASRTSATVAPARPARSVRPARTAWRHQQASIPDATASTSTEWMRRRRNPRVDLDDAATRSHATTSGAAAALGVGVDPERDRLFVSSLWGLEIFDLKTDALVARKRHGARQSPRHRRRAPAEPALRELDGRGKSAHPRSRHVRGDRSDPDRHRVAISVADCDGGVVRELGGRALLLGRGRARAPPVGGAPHPVRRGRSARAVSWVRRGRQERTAPGAAATPHSRPAATSNPTAPSPRPMPASRRRPAPARRG